MSKTDSVVTQEDIRSAALWWVGQKNRETFPEDMVYAEYNWQTIGPVKHMAETLANHRINSTRQLEATIEELRAENERAFKHGFLIAVSTMLHQHDDPVMAEDALRDSGLTWEDVKRLGLDDFDTKVLRPVFQDMERKDALARTGDV